MYRIPERVEVALRARRGVWAISSVRFSAMIVGGDYLFVVVGNPLIEEADAIAGGEGRFAWILAN